MYKKELELIEKDSDIYSVEEWYETVNDGGFIDYDGHGDWATQTHYYPSNPWMFGYGESARPSLGLSNKPDWATHVVWYNR